MTARLVAAIVALAGCDRIFGNDPLPDAGDGFDAAGADVPGDGPPPRCTRAMDELLCITFDRREGDIIRDESSYTNDAVAVLAPATMRDDEAAIMVGDSSQVTIADQNKLDVRENLTFAAWVRFDTQAPDATVLDNNNQYGLSIVPGPEVECSLLVHPPGIPSIAPRTSAPVSSGEWFHAACVKQYVGSDSVLRSYVDGVLVDEMFFATGPTNVGNPQVVTIGQDSEEEGIVKPLTGAIDEVRIYSRALDAEEIFELARQ